MTRHRVKQHIKDQANPLTLMRRLAEGITKSKRQLH